MSAHPPDDRGCVPNIGERGRRRRLVGGALWLVVGIAATIVISRRHAGVGWQLALVVPFMLAALGYFQARERT